MGNSALDLPPQSAPVTTLIRPTRGWAPLNLAEIWEFRELIWFLAWRDVSARYKQTAVGIAWAVIQPIIAMVVFTIVFGRLAKIPSDGWHYPVFVFAGMLPWQYFSGAVLGASSSLIKNMHLITKVHCPKLCIPLAALIPPLFDFCAGFVVLIGLVLWFKMEITWRLLYLPIFLGLAIITALGVSLWLSALSIEFRDVQHVLPFLVQMWMFASPVVYSNNLVPKEMWVVYGINPMSGVIAGFRWMLGSVGGQRFPTIVVSSCAALFLLVTGAYFFRRMERTFADVV